MAGERVQALEEGAHVPALGAGKQVKGLKDVEQVQVLEDVKQEQALEDGAQAPGWARLGATGKVLPAWWSLWAPGVRGEEISQDQMMSSLFVCL